MRGESWEVGESEAYSQPERERERERAMFLIYRQKSNKVSETQIMSRKINKFTLAEFARKRQ